MKINKDYLKFLKFISIILILIGVYYLGYGIGHKNITIDSSYKPKIVNLNDGKPKDVDFSIFWDAWDIVKNAFVKKDIDYTKMVHGAISGMLASLNDPYTVFMTNEQSENFKEDLNGSFDGIGIEVTPKDGYLVVIAPLDGLPAQKAGIRSKDMILKIDGAEVNQMNYSEAINKIRGPKGTEVTLSILHDGDTEPTDIKVIRDKVVVKSVKWEIINNDIMYIRISQFGDDTFDLVNQAIDEVSSKGIKKVIVDVRDDPGGYLEKCIDITSLFISEGVVVKEEDRNGKIIESMTTHLPRLNNEKVVVLINGGSASASEIFAGAIQDHQRGLLIGEKSFGKGSVQNLETLKDGSQVKITIAKWLTPNGKAIDKEGIMPDIEVKASDEDIQNKNDVQLQKAIEEVSK